MNSLVPLHNTPIVNRFLDGKTEKDGKHRLSLFARWLMDTNGRWEQPDLAAYRDYLLYTYTGVRGKPLSPASAAAHLSTIRGRYAALLRDNAVRDDLLKQAPQDASAADKKAFVDEVLQRLQNTVNPAYSPVKVIKVQDASDSAHIRLTPAQAARLVNAPFQRTDNTPIQALRDSAILSLMLCTGLREAELTSLDMSDLRHRLGDKLALLVREGKGCKQRLVPYGEMAWCLQLVERWLTLAGITAGAIFRGFYKDGKSVRVERLTTRTVVNIVERYPLDIDGQAVSLNPHDLRRTYARLMYEAGMELVAIQQNLGHADLKTTLHYVGTLDADKRAGKAAFTVDLATIERHKPLM